QAAENEQSGYGNTAWREMPAAKATKDRHDDGESTDHHSRQQGAGALNRFRQEQVVEGVPGQREKQEGTPVGPGDRPPALFRQYSQEKKRRGAEHGIAHERQIGSCEGMDEPRCDESQRPKRTGDEPGYHGYDQDPPPLIQ